MILVKLVWKSSRKRLVLVMGTEVTFPISCIFNGLFETDFLKIAYKIIVVGNIYWRYIFYLETPKKTWTSFSNN